MINAIKGDLQEALAELYAASKLGEGAILVVGCSTSEVIGERIGTAGSEEAASAIFGTIGDFCRERGIYIAAQCCEHLNRALVVEKELYLRDRLTRVNAVPRRKAGGAFATEAYARMQDPVLVESIEADFGIDIGHTLIGMHLKTVAVPVRTSITAIGEAPIVLARTRCKYIGGERAGYDPDLG